MPGTPPTSPILTLPRYSGADAADFATEVNAIIDELESKINKALGVVVADTNGHVVGTPPIGACIPYNGTGEPPEGEWTTADGKLIDRGTYATYFARVGHAYNLGVDPGSNKVKVSDKRGKSPIGAINMGTAAGAAGNDNAHCQIGRGSSGGEAGHTLSVTEMPSHAHADAGHMHGSYGSGFMTLNDQQNYTYSSVYQAGVSNHAMAPDGRTTVAAAAIQNTGGGGAHNIVHPVEADNWIVRIA